jgi:sodium transport system permease protein
METSIVNVLDVNRGVENFDLAEDVNTMFYFLPMLILMLLCNICASFAPESIAGEKERGTIATLLITPVQRSHIALGKIMALSIIAILSATASALGTILSLPKLMGSDIGGNIYGMGEYLLLAGVLLSTVLLIVTLISLISSLAKSVKEATTLTTPLMILVMFMGVLAMNGPSQNTGYFQFMIPLYNSVQTMVRIFTFSNASIPTLITAVSNLVYTGLGVWGLTALFRSERILSTT